MEQAENPLLWKFRRAGAIVGKGWGFRGLLWLVVAHLATHAVQPLPSVPVLGALCVTGLLCQACVYKLSQRPGLFVYDRPMLFIVIGAALSTLVALVVLALLTCGIYLSYLGPPTSFNHRSLFWTALLATCLIASGFQRRAAMLRMQSRYFGGVNTARPAARVLMPTGAFSLHRVLERLNALPAQSNGGGEPSLKGALEEFVQDLRVRCDSRFARPVPWLTASEIVQNYIETLRRSPRHRAVSLEFNRGEHLDEIRVRPSLLCGLLDAAVLSAKTPGARVVLRSSEREGSLVLQLEAQGIPAGGEAESKSLDITLAIAREANIALADGVMLDPLPCTDGLLAYSLVYEPTPPHQEADWEALHSGSEEARVLSDCYHSKGAKRCFTRDGLVIRAQRTDVLDPKPTLLEEEYHMMRRLADVSPSFPRVVGFGSKGPFEWLSYQYEEGKVLGEWLQEPANQGQWFRVIAEVDNIIRRMRENSVAHRDLNPGNLIVREDGSLVLIDFDQAVADDERFSDADRSGKSAGLANNDIEAFLERCDLVRKANHAVKLLNDAWQLLGAQPGGPPYEFEFAGHRFAGEVPWYEEWSPLAHALTNVRGKRVLNLAGGIGLLDTFLASHGASVTSVLPPGPRREAAQQIAQAAQVSIAWIPAEPGAEPTPYDLVVSVGPNASGIAAFASGPATGLGGQVLFEHPSSIDDARRLLKRYGFTWRGVIGYSPRLRPLIAAARPNSTSEPDWLKVRKS